MGLNIAGLVIDKNYEDNLAELEAILGEKLLFENEVTFDDALENWKGDNYCDIYFSEKGTLVFLSMETGGFEFYAGKQIAFSFVLSEMTMMFCVNYVENDKLIRSIMETDEGIMEDDGEPFDFEEEEEDKSELIYHLIEKTLGESFHDIDFEAKCLRYSFQPATQTEKITTNAANHQEAKPWWKFW